MLTPSVFPATRLARGSGLFVSLAESVRPFVTLTVLVIEPVALDRMAASMVIVTSPPLPSRLTVPRMSPNDGVVGSVPEALV